jgi:predicted HAD superfamily phosphohydrolase YqeG
MSRGVRIAVFSNAKSTDRLDVLTRRGVHVITKTADGRPVAPKPAAEGFDTAARIFAEQYGIKRGEVAMVGDNYITDGGAIRAGYAFIKVKPVPTKGQRSLSRAAQKTFRGLYDGVAKVHDLFRPKSQRALHLR